MKPRPVPPPMRRTAAGSAALGYPEPATGWYIAATLFLATVFAYLDRGIIGVIVQPLRAEFRISDTDVSLLHGLAFSICYAFAALPLGWLADRYNRRNLAVFGVVVWSAMTVLCGFAHSFAQLFMARIGVGLGEAAIIPAANSILADCFSPERRGRPMGLLVAGASVGGALSNLGAGLLLMSFAGRTAVYVPLIGELAPWRLVFIAAGLPGLAVALLMLTFREPARLSVTAESYDAVSKDGGFLGYAGRHARVFAGVYLTISMVFLLSNASSAWVAVALIRKYGMSEAHAGILSGFGKLAANGLGAFAGGLLGDLMVGRNARLGRLRVVLVAYPLVPIGGVVMLVAPSAVGYLIGFIVAAAAMALASGVSYAIVHEVAPAKFRGISIAWCLFSSNLLGLGLGPSLVAVVNDRIFGDDRMIAQALAWVQISGAGLGLLLLCLFHGAYERLRSVPSMGASGQLGVVRPN